MLIKSLSMKKYIKPTIFLVIFTTLSLVLIIFLTRNNKPISEINLENSNTISCQSGEECIIDITRDPENPCCWGCGYEIINKAMQMERLKECPLGSSPVCKKVCKAYPRDWVHSRCNLGKCEIFYKKP